MAERKRRDQVVLSALRQAAPRVIDLLKVMDEDGSKRVDRQEFAEGLDKLGVEASAEDITSVFNSIDLNGDGQLSYKELQTLLRPETLSTHKFGQKKG